MLAWALQNTVLGGVMAGLVVLACRLRRMSPAMRHALWVLVIVKLMTPPLVSWPWRWPEVSWPITSVQIERVHPGSAARVDEDASGAWSEEQEQAFVDPGDATLAMVHEASVVEAVPSSVPGAAPAISTGEPSAPLLWIWMAGSLLVGCLETIRIVRASRALRSARRPSRELMDLVLEVSRRLGVRPPPVRLTGRAASPFLWCLGRPTLVLPEALIGELCDDAVRSVIAHELAHLKRRDHWIGWLELAAETVWWWSPVFWLARREARDSAELACDAWVVWALPGSRRAFAEALIEVCQRFTEYEAPAPALGMSGGGRQAFFRRRLQMILLESVPRRVSIARLLCAGLVGLAFLPAWTQESDVSSTTPPAIGEAPPAAQEPPAPPPAPPPPGGQAKPAPGPRGELPAIPGLAPPRHSVTKPAPAPRPPMPKYAPGAPPEEEAVDTEPALEERYAQAAREYSRWKPYRAGDAGIPGGGDSQALADRVSELEKTIAQVNRSVSELRQALMSKEPLEPMAGMGQPPYAGAMPPRQRVARSSKSRPGQGEGERQHIAETFQLPKAKAEALAAFLKEHVDSSLEATVHGDQLILESDAPTNAAVHVLIPLMSRAK